MPLPKGTRYRVVTTKTGKKVRQAWYRGKLIETKNLKTGATHTPAEFRADERKRKAAKKKKGKVKGKKKKG